MSALPLLYSYRRCPYAIRARLALHRAGIAFELHDLKSLRDKPAGMLALSPKGTVPVLQLPDGTVLEQSLDIMQWALRQHDPEGWLTNAPMAAMQTLIDRNDGPFKALLDGYKYPERHPDQARDAWREQALASHLAPFDASLRNHANLLGDQASLADMAIAPFVRQFAQVDRDWFDHCPLQSLRNWLDRIVSSELFQTVMRKT